MVNEGSRVSVRRKGALSLWLSQGVLMGEFVYPFFLSRIKSVKHRPWILGDQLTNLEKPNTQHLNTNISVENTLPKGVIRGCPSCSNCQKVIACWRPEEGCRPSVNSTSVLHPTEEINALKDLHSKRKLIIEQKDGSDGFEFESGPEFTLPAFTLPAFKSLVEAFGNNIKYRVVVAKTAYNKNKSAHKQIVIADSNIRTVKLVMRSISGFSVDASSKYLETASILMRVCVCSGTLLKRVIRLLKNTFLQRLPLRVTVEHLPGLPERMKVAFTMVSPPATMRFFIKFYWRGLFSLRRSFSLSNVIDEFSYKAFKRQCM
ncbi:JmjC domain-containing protein [Artemisia annua]|uniref:JmjC domain-containing protein n=1 Tax=Artemisia annua TaxID=35608 RepID=A0A2U1Q3V0_ARTAN|nr:JmjC domain-containing protein [Artemisia annua]